MTTINCVGHGQDMANLAQIMQGNKLDTPPTKFGKQQALNERSVEFDYGTWDGQLLTELYSPYPMYFDEPHNLVPNSWEVSKGAPAAQVTAKLESFLVEVARKYPAQTLLGVSHGFTLKLLVALLLGIRSLQNLSKPANISLTKSLVTPDTKTLVHYGKWVADYATF